MNLLDQYDAVLTDRSPYAYTVLRWSVGITVFLAGFHKFFNGTTWTRYIAPWFTDLAFIPDHTFMLLLGGAEVAVGLLLLADYRTEYMALVAAGSLLVVLFNLLTTGRFVDVLIRDLGLFGAAIGVALLAAQQTEE